MREDWAEHAVLAHVVGACELFVRDFMMYPPWIISESNGNTPKNAIVFGFGPATILSALYEMVIDILGSTTLFRGTNMLHSTKLIPLVEVTYSFQNYAS